MPVAEMLSRISAAELTEWEAHEKMNGPFGPERSDIHAGVIAATIANVNRSKRGKTYRPKDFIPKWDRPVAQTPEQMKEMLIAMTHRLGGKVVRKGTGQ